MGNANAVSKEVKVQGLDRKLYELVDMKGGGELITLMKEAKSTNDYTKIDKRIQQIAEDPKHTFLYPNGKSIRISELIRYRNKGESSFKSRNVGTKNIGNSFAKERNVIDKESYREVCWSMEERGSVGETILHLCFLNSSRTHADVAKRLIKFYPKLINDIYAGDEYYGENVLHMAIVNEDPAMVKFLLDNGADCRARTCGNFFCPDDQKTSRTDNSFNEWIDVCQKTNYEGHVYFGEYPLGFAACLGQEECVRLLVAKDKLNNDHSTPLTNLQDANGNTVLHMLIIHDKKEMFDLVHSLGGDLSIKNNQGLTPLTLAAKLARKGMYEHLLEIERAVYWKYGNVTCAGFPLQNIDTISTNGEINPQSALNLIVYGKEQGHLDMMEGLVENLLREKWKTFVRYRFYRRFVIFGIYFLAFAVAFALRPGRDYCADDAITTELYHCNKTQTNKTSDPCYLLRPYSDLDIVRLVLECCVLLTAISYLLLALKEIYHQGFRGFFITLRGAPAKAMFLLSCVFVVMMLPGRASCAHEYEDYMGIFAILGTAPYFLFFCRGFKMVGPFVVMIYNMIQGDLFRFVIIYAIFVIGFSQAMFIVFRDVESSPFNSIGESIMGMFIMSLGQFGDFYDSFSESKHQVMGKIIFLVYMVLVTLLLVNMLIAMMGNTYQLIASTEKEWLRQWAKIVLVVEQSVSTSERLQKQMLYSQPRSETEEGRALVVRSHQTEKERREEERLREFHRVQQKMLAKQKKRIKIRAMNNAANAVDVSKAKEGKVNI
ncbi:hypothetical protein SNE40_000264 [Patella caerulea]|uniref:Ion transport domain-containing protein n=1 Tax=Patella caerulea TaxID=87958 RepID=A0AAN8KKT6_PATCE